MIGFIYLAILLKIYSIFDQTTKRKWETNGQTIFFVLTRWIDDIRMFVNDQKSVAVILVNFATNGS